MTQRLTISRGVSLFGLIAAVCFAAVIATSIYGLSQLKIGGPLYDRIKLGNDLVADILPPPEYIIEAYLETTLALNDPASLPVRRDRIAQLKADYNERRQFWSTSDLNPAIKQQLVVQSDVEVQRIWQTIEQQFMPALAAGDLAAARRAYAQITADYAAHRTIIDAVVKQALAENTATEALAAARGTTLAWLMWTVSGIVAVVLGAGILGVILGVIRPITAMTRAMQRLADGDLDVVVPSAGRRDEMGAMAGAVTIFRDNLGRVRALEAEQAAAAIRSDADRKAALNAVADNFNTAIVEIVKTVSAASSEIEHAAGGLTLSAEKTQQLSTTVAASSAQSSASAQSAAAASEQMASTVLEIGRQVKQASTISRDAVRQAEQTNSRITDLAQSSSRISEVVKLIGSVADQTNLLALNATIEAARAGDAGRGFAVVASEVKALAAQTGKATEEIGNHIAQMQSAMQSSVSAIQEISGTIDQICDISNAIAAAVEQQGIASQEISRNVQQAAAGASDVAGNIAEVSRGARHTGVASGQVHGLAQALMQQSDHLAHAVTDFIGQVRSA